MPSVSPCIGSAPNNNFHNCKTFLKECRHQNLKIIIKTQGYNIWNVNFSISLADYFFCEIQGQK